VFFPPVVDSYEDSEITVPGLKYNNTTHFLIGTMACTVEQKLSHTKIYRIKVQITDYD